MISPEGGEEVDKYECIGRSEAEEERKGRGGLTDVYVAWRGKSRRGVGGGGWGGGGGVGGEEGEEVS